MLLLLPQVILYCSQCIEFLPFEMHCLLDFQSSIIIYKLGTQTKSHTCSLLFAGQYSTTKVYQKRLEHVPLKQSATDQTLPLKPHTRPA